MKLSNMIALCGLLALICGCATRERSISTSGVDCASGNCVRNEAPIPTQNGAFTYRGELNEFDLLGIDRRQFVTEDQIASALEDSPSARLTPGEPILLIQSGAMFPDSEMVRAMEKHFHVVPFPGVPPAEMRAGDDHDHPSFARVFRLAAARAGATHIVCYWGAIESMRGDMSTKMVSWVPLAGWVIPDETEAMRLRLKVAVIDVRSGAWTVASPESPVDRSAWSNRFNRDRVDQRQVQHLKELAYAAGVKELLRQTNP